MERISVALCTYNGRPFLSEQLESILSQTRPPDEIVVFDDNSSDGTRKILREYASGHPDLFNVHYNERTRGVVRNFEQCIKACDCDLISLADQDDVWCEEKLERHSQIFQKSDPVLTFHNSTITDEQLNPESNLWSEIEYHPRDIRGKLAAVKELARRNVVQGATCCFRSELVPKITPIPKKWPHDHYIAIKASLFGDLHDIDEELLYYRQHDEQVVGARSDLREWLLQSLRTSAVEYEAEAKKWEILRQELNLLDAKELDVDLDTLKDIIDQRIDYEKSRGTIRDNRVSFLNRLHLIIRNIKRGRYHIYGNGYQSLLRDFLAFAPTI